MPIIKTILITFREKGVHGIRALIQGKLFPFKKDSINKRNLYLKYFNDKKGLEIGGPSEIFSTEIPIYQVINSLDGCNFSNHTIWEGNISEGDAYNYYNDKTGYQYICEASDLQAISNENYDFLISSHCLEHCANPLKTVNEWLRVLKKGGAILLILPDKKYTFDHNRPITTFQHLLEDFNNDIDENDLTHLGEILELHDLKMDAPAGTKEHFKNRSLDNFRNRCLHHHVFDSELLQNIFAHFNIRLINITVEKSLNQIIIGIKQ